MWVRLVALGYPLESVLFMKKIVLFLIVTVLSIACISCANSNENSTSENSDKTDLAEVSKKILKTPIQIVLYVKLQMLWIARLKFQIR